MNPLYACPSDRGLRRNQWLSHHALPRIGPITSSTPAIPTTGNWSKALRRFSAPFTFIVKTPLNLITDGTSHTLMMSEVVVLPELATQADSGGWGGPPSDFETSLGGQKFEGFYPPNSSSPDQVAVVVQPAGTYDAMQIPVPQLIPGGETDAAMLAQVLTARSRHPGGVVAAYCDGSVHFCSNELNSSAIITPKGLTINIWAATASCAKAPRLFTIRTKLCGLRTALAALLVPRSA